MARNQQISTATVSRELNLDPYLPYKGYTATVDSSETIAATIGEALPDLVVAVTVVNYDLSLNLYVQFDGTAADNTAFAIPPGAGMTIPGDSVAQALVRLYASSTINVGIIPYVLQK